MKFIRQDGRIYEVTHADTIRRLKGDGKFKEVEDITVEQLKQYAKQRGLTGYSALGREELINRLEGGG